MSKVNVTYTLHDPIDGHKFTKTTSLKGATIYFEDGTRFQDMFIGGIETGTDSCSYTFIPLACVNKIGGLKVEFEHGDFCDYERRNNNA